MKNLFYITVLASVLFLAACGDDEQPIDPPIDEEVITTMVYTLASTNSQATLTFRDTDGDGGNPPIVTVENLAANTTYTGVLTFANESETPTEDVTVEIAEEDLEHQVFFATTVNGLSITYNDADDNGRPVGLATTLTTGDAGTGTLTITLRHQPDKTATGVTDGDITNAGGETDIEVSFDITVQ